MEVCTWVHLVSGTGTIPSPGQPTDARGLQDIHLVWMLLVRGAGYGQGMGAPKFPTRNPRLLHGHQSLQQEALQYRRYNLICVCTILTSWNCRGGALYQGL